MFANSLIIKGIFTNYQSEYFVYCIQTIIFGYKLINYENFLSRSRKNGMEL